MALCMPLSIQQYIPRVGASDSDPLRRGVSCAVCGCYQCLVPHHRAPHLERGTGADEGRGDCACASSTLVGTPMHSTSRRVILSLSNGRVASRNASQCAVGRNLLRITKRSDRQRWRGLSSSRFRRVRDNALHPCHFILKGPISSSGF